MTADQIAKLVAATVAEAMKANETADTKTVRAGRTTAAKPKPATRKSAQAAKRDRVNATTAKAKAAGTHRVLPQGQTTPATVVDLTDDFSVQLSPRNVNGARLSPLSSWGKPEKSVTRAAFLQMIENADAILAAFDAVEQDAGIGDYAPVADTDGED